MTPPQMACAICGAAFPKAAAPPRSCHTCGAPVAGAARAGDDLFAPTSPKFERPPEPTTKERAIAILKASGFWGVIGLVAGAMPLGILGAMLTGVTLDTGSRIMVGGGFGATVGSILGITWGAVRVEELSTPKALGFGVIIGIPLSTLYRFFLFPSHLMPESSMSDSVVMGVFAGVMCGAIVSWLNRE